MRRITLIGAGPDGTRWLTQEAADALAACDLLIGARRLLDAHVEHQAEKVAAVAVEAVQAALSAHPQQTRIAVLLSGDTGFYSGAKRLAEAFPNESVTILPGICAHQLLCARLGVSWDDACLVSVHGRAQDVCATVLNHAKTIVLTGDNMLPQDVCAALVEGGMGFVRVTVGQRLGYPNEAIHAGDAASLALRIFDPLSVLLIENDRPLLSPTITPGLPDDAFLRTGAPMTKREVRAVSLAMLAPREADTVWDIGAGTGAVAIECALLCRRGRVFAIERDEAACDGIRANRTHFGTWHLRVVHGEAPAALAALPAPDRVFIGGSGGELREILSLVRDVAPAARVVINAITLETLAEAMQAMHALGFEAVTCTQVAAARAKPVGAYHMMTAQNPVFIIAGGGA